MKSLYVNISGSVQGVGFRYYAQQHAKALGIVGYVKNLVTGELEVFAQGNPESLEDFLDLMRTGPSRAYVRDVRVIWKDVGLKYERFEVAY